MFMLYVKPVVLLLGVFFLTGSKHPEDNYAKEVKWEHWNTGYPKAVREKKIVLVDTYTNWCGWCKKMDKETYANADIIKKVNKYFVPIKFNPELKETYQIDGETFNGRELQTMLSKGNKTGYPTTYFILINQNRLLIHPGFIKAADFSITLDNIIAESKKQ
jgi:uncharacterized protein YyaL (SSP411 family)